MRKLHLYLIVGLIVSSAATSAKSFNLQQVLETRQLRGLTAEEATSLIANLTEAQRLLRAGEPVTFELLSGSVASYAMTEVAPRDAFLTVPFEEVWEIERLRTDTPLWRPYRLAYAPDGVGKLYWDVEVILGFSGNIERVQMVYKPPAPF
jgi:hypothetical protein